MKTAYRIVLLVFTALAVGGCNERDSNDGEVINNILLPTDVVLNLYCPNVGINDEQCVLADPENPFAVVAVPEPDQVPEDEDGNPAFDDKFALASGLPPGPSGAKARFYLWATALARRQTGENQWYTALALHELFDANSNNVFQDELIREHTKRAYRSVLDNFFGQVTFFEFANNLVPFHLNEIVARSIVFSEEETGFRALVGAPLEGLALLGEWGYTYNPENDTLSRNE